MACLGIYRAFLTVSVLDVVVVVARVVVVKVVFAVVLPELSWRRSRCHGDQGSSSEEGEIGGLITRRTRIDSWSRSEAWDKSPESGSARGAHQTYL